MIGKTVAHYKIVSKLGEGGMGEVFLADDTELDRKVALKFLPPRFASDKDALERFKREARAAAALDHPNIITIHEIGEHDRSPYIAMAYVDGQSLSKVIASGELSLSRILDLTLQISDGLTKAHAAGVVHRDLKPDNILVDTDGRAKILDFGLAKLGDLTKLTKEDSTVGTLYYMSPQQAQGEQVDARADLFSLGAILYEMVTGQRAFSGEHAAALHYAVANTDPQPLSRLSREATPELERIVFKLLKKDPAERYQSAADLAADIRALQSSPMSAASVSAGAPPRGRSTRFVIPALVVVVIALGVVLNPFRKEAVRVADARPMIVVLPFENLGSHDDEYFADGITEEITSRLGGIGGLGVISRTSAMKYKATEKTLAEIARELGVAYVLEGTIRWDKSGATSRVRITPQLIRASDDTHVWADNYERELTQIFEVQADIATKVAEAMQLTLLETDRTAIADRPTENMEAYTYYLRGREHARDVTSAGDLANAVSMVEKAIALDPAFAEAYAFTAMYHAAIYHNGLDRTPQRLKLSRSAADRAMALKPKAMESPLAMAYYYYWGFKDYDRALEYLDFAAQLRPEQVDVLQTYGWIYRRQGRFRDTISYLRRCMMLDPQNPTVLTGLVETYKHLHDYARADSCALRLIDLLPEQDLVYFYRALLPLKESGDLVASRRALDDMPRVNSNEWPYHWHYQYFLERDYTAAIDILEESSTNALTFEFYYKPNSLLQGQCYRMLGDRERAGAAFEAARVTLERAIAKRPDDPRLYKSMGLALAGLGRKGEAVRFGERAVEMYPLSLDAYVGQVYIYDLAAINAMVGNAEAAVKNLETILRRGVGITIYEVELDPLFDSLRERSDYENMVARYRSTS